MKEESCSNILLKNIFETNVLLFLCRTSSDNICNPVQTEKNCRKIFEFSVLKFPHSEFIGTKRFRCREVGLPILP